MNILCQSLIILTICVIVLPCCGSTSKDTTMKTYSSRDRGPYPDVEDTQTLNQHHLGKMFDNSNRKFAEEPGSTETNGSVSRTISPELYSTDEARMGAPHIDIDKVHNPDCIHSTVVLTCRTIPKTIPSAVSTVIVTSHDNDIPDQVFKDPSFANVSHLYLNGAGLNEFSDDSFRGLDNLVNLTLSGMRNLHGYSLQLAMSRPNVLPKLKNFALNTGEMFKSPFLRLEEIFLNKLVMNDIDCFNLSNVITEVKYRDILKFAYLLSNLSVVNLTGSFLIIDFSGSYDEYTNMTRYNLEKPLMTILDTSRLRTTNVTSSYSMRDMSQNNTHSNYSLCNITPTMFSEFFLVEIWYLRNALTSQTNYAGYCDLSNENVFWKKVVVSGNYISKLNITFIFPQNNTLRYVDLSNNRVRYVGPRMFSTWIAVEKLILSRNELYYMEHLPEFGNLTSTMKRLSHLDLANNNFTFIHPHMFQSNKQLMILNIANNHLNSITFDLTPLTELRELDIRGNAIITLDSAELARLQLIFQTRHENLNIMFADNPIQCSCESVEFIVWLVSVRDVTKEHIACDFNRGSISVDNAAVRKCKFLCNRTLIVAVSTVSSIAIVTLVLSSVVVIRRFKTRQKRENIEQHLRESIAVGNFMCFMSISGNDEPLVEKVLLQNLRRFLQGKFGIERDLVCTGYRFKPGFPICEEAYRLIKRCHVVVSVVSESFLRSQYCKLELQEACKQNKPMILTYLGQVETDDLPQYMQEVFKRTSRAWIRQNDDGHYYVVPSLVDMCDAIWDLAIADLLNRI